MYKCNTKIIPFTSVYMMKEPLIHSWLVCYTSHFPAPHHPWLPSPPLPLFPNSPPSVPHHFPNTLTLPRPPFTIPLIPSSCHPAQPLNPQPSPLPLLHLLTWAIINNRVATSSQVGKILPAKWRLSIPPRRCHRKQKKKNSKSCSLIFAKQFLQNVTENRELQWKWSVLCGSNSPKMLCETENRS